MSDSGTSTATAPRDSELNSSAEQSLLKALQLVLAAGMHRSGECPWLWVHEAVGDAVAGLENLHFMCDMWALSWPWPLWLWEVDL